MIVDYLCFASSHEDLETWAALEAGIDDFLQLVVCLSYYEFDNKEHKRYAIVDKDDTATLAQSLGLDVTGLPEMLCDEYKDDYSWSPSEVEAIFQDVLEKILDHGVKYHLK